MVTVERERRFFWIIASSASAAAWLTLIFTGSELTVPVSCSAPFATGLPSTNSFALALALNPPAAMLMGWALMCAAMMGPVLVAPALNALAVDPARPRALTVLPFLLGYAFIWAIAGAGLLAVALTLRLASPNFVPVGVLAAVIALAWQASLLKRRCLDGCRALPGPAAGVVVIPALRVGLGHGAWCVGSCWSLMLFCLLVPRAHLVTMALAAAWIYLERLEPSTAQCWRSRFLNRPLSALAATYLSRFRARLPPNIGTSHAAIKGRVTYLDRKQCICNAGHDLVA